MFGWDFQGYLIAGRVLRACFGGPGCFLGGIGGVMGSGRVLWEMFGLELGLCLGS